MVNTYKHAVEIYNDLRIFDKYHKGQLKIYDKNKKPVFEFWGSTGTLYLGDKEKSGNIQILDKNYKTVFSLAGDDASLTLGNKGNGGELRISDKNYNSVFGVVADKGILYVGNKDNDGKLEIYDSKEERVLSFDSKYAILKLGNKGNDGDLQVLDKKGKVRIRLDGDSGDIKLHGADCAENFNVTKSDTVTSGTVLVIGDNDTLHPCKHPYDKRVAGVVSGANGYKPGIILDSKLDKENTRFPIALSGKTYCKVDATYSKVEAGDLLTTSPTIGYAMKADDPMKSFGSVIGKALKPLHGGKGLISILVALQ